MTGIVVGVCEACGTQSFPVPEWCPACGSDHVASTTAGDGTVEETTILRHVAGTRLGPVRIGTVRLAGGAVLIARLEDGAGTASVVTVSLEDEAPVARLHQPRN